MKEIPLTQGKVAFVDDEDYELVTQFSWQAVKDPNSWYARAHVPSASPPHRKIRLHRLLLGALPGEEVDHWNGNGLDCQKLNLRLATHTQNQQGFRTKSGNCTSRYRGVIWDALRFKWRASIRANGKQVHLGRFENETEAAKAYDTAAFTHFGEFASPNFK